MFWKEDLPLVPLINFCKTSFSIWFFLLWVPQQSKMSTKGPQNISFGKNIRRRGFFWEEEPLQGVNKILVIGSRAIKFCLRGGGAINMFHQAQPTLNSTSTQTQAEVSLITTWYHPLSRTLESTLHTSFRIQKDILNSLKPTQSISNFWISY